MSDATKALTHRDFTDESRGMMELPGLGSMTTYLVVGPRDAGLSTVSAAPEDGVHVGL